VNGVIGIVGSNKSYAPHVEFGTRPHWPPPGALALWAKRHNVDEFAMMRGIARHGTRPRHYLRNAFESEKNNVIADVRNAIRSAINQLTQ